MLFRKFNFFISLLKPLEVREHKKTENCLKIDKLGVWNESIAEANELVRRVNAVELGRIVAR